MREQEKHKKTSGKCYSPWLTEDLKGKDRVIVKSCVVFNKCQKRERK